MNKLQQNYETSMENYEALRAVSHKFNDARLALSFLLTEKDANNASRYLNTVLKNYTELLTEGFNCVYYGLFSAYFYGNAVKDVKKAQEYLLKGVELNDSACKGELAFMYLAGCPELSVKQDLEKSKEILKSICYEEHRTLDNFFRAMKYPDSKRSGEFMVGLIKIYMSKLIIYIKHGGFGEDEKEQKKQIKVCQQNIKYYMKHNYYAEKWAKQVRKEYLR